MIPDLSALSQGFLSPPILRQIGDGIHAEARFERSKFHPDLFEILAIPRPETLARAVDKRLADYLAGRALARIAQTALGLSTAPIPSATSRAPIWPADQAGSISHTKGICACYLVPKEAGFPGIDVELPSTGHALESIQKMVLRDPDAAYIANTPLPAEIAATLVFSAKETLFKALFPVVQSHFGFASATVSAPIMPNHLTLELTKDLHPTLPKGRSFSISYETKPTHVTTYFLHDS
ncbi:4'-phosphopantetheinyl transferase superfamily protein [Tropicibacter sp. R15_0]|uniref:4'-phosphopantetheinyl transferase family protein n=1 Tax=Tropicibacter sp. R15_0 TaxID=2821101 RepID=UPI001ADD2967|nr:4'-phosphopantetheinyl transferase superfamily protein [Tropicibacter sp. R15_0]MBO9467955.1 4'-phosphopantetheinyl transferase superfamily protein [Tropicibacter sp. R15_0]